MRADRCYDYIDHPINEVTTKLSKLRLYSYQTSLDLTFGQRPFWTLFSYFSEFIVGAGIQGESNPSARGC